MCLINKILGCKKVTFLENNIEEMNKLSTKKELEYKTKIKKLKYELENLADSFDAAQKEIEKLHKALVEIQHG